MMIRGGLSGFIVRLACGFSLISGLAAGQTTPRPRAPGAPTYSVSTSSFIIDGSTPKILINYSLGAYSDRHFPVTDGRPADGQKIAISARADWPFFPAADVKLSLPYGKGRVRLVYTIHGATFDEKHYTVSTAQLSGFASWVVAQVEKIERGFDANTTIPAVTDVTVTVIPVFSNPGVKLTEFAVDGGFEIEFQQVVPAAGDKGATLQGVIPASGSSASEGKTSAQDDSCRRPKTLPGPFRLPFHLARGQAVLPRLRSGRKKGDRSKGKAAPP